MPMKFSSSWLILSVAATLVLSTSSTTTGSLARIRSVWQPFFRFFEPAF